MGAVECPHQQSQGRGVTILYMRKIGPQTLRVDDAHSEELLMGKWKVGDVLKCTVKRPRNPNQHRLYWAVLQTVFENSDKWPTVEALHRDLKLALGLVDWHVSMWAEKHITYPVPRSIAFDSMSQDEFEEYLQKALEKVEEATSIPADELLKAGQERLHGGLL